MVQPRFVETISAMSHWFSNYMWTYTYELTETTYVSMLLCVEFQQEGITQERSVTWFCSPQIILQSLLISLNNFPDFFVNQEWGITVGTQCLPSTYIARVVWNTVYLYKFVKLLTRKIKGNNHGKSNVTVILNLYKTSWIVIFFVLAYISYIQQVFRLYIII